MPNRLNLPAELASLIEKRELDDRRKEAVAKAAHDATEQSSSHEERRSGEDRRTSES